MLYVEYINMSFSHFVLYLQVEPEMVDTYKATMESYMSKPYEERDAGFDLSAITATPFTKGPASKLMFGVRAGFYDSIRGHFRAYWLLPRSSISKTPLRLANSMGLIDAGYRGPLIAMVDCTTDSYTVEANQRLFQLSNPELLPWKEIRIVSEIPGGPTLRGEGGFGSTDSRRESGDSGLQSGSGSTDSSLQSRSSNSAARGGDTPRPPSSPGFSPTVHEYNAYGC
jgi:dUTP pyrophosphatase